MSGRLKLSNNLLNRPIAVAAVVIRAVADGAGGLPCGAGGRGLSGSGAAAWRLALTGLVLGVLFVDNVQTALAAHDLAVGGALLD